MIDFKHKVRFFMDDEEICFAQFKDSVIPQKDTEVFVNDSLCYVKNICFDYGFEDDTPFVLVDVYVLLVENFSDI